MSASAPPGAGTPARGDLPQLALARLLRDARADLGDYGALAALLEQQFDGALRHDGAQLQTLAQQVGTLLDTLDERRRTRVALLRELLGPHTPIGVAALLARLPATQRAPVQALWDRLENAVRDCKSRNARNARLVTEQHALLQRVLHGTEEPLYADA